MSGKRVMCCRWEAAALDRAERAEQRAEAAVAALAVAERETSEPAPFVASEARICRICDQVSLSIGVAIDHAPDCPFAVLAAAGEGQAVVSDSLESATTSASMSDSAVRVFESKGEADRVSHCDPA